VGPSIVVTTIWTAPGAMSGTSTRSAGWFVASKTISFLIGSMTAMTAPLRTKPTMLLRGLGMKPAPVMMIFAPAGADAGDTAAGLGAGIATVTTALDSSDAPGTVASAVIVATPGPIRVTLNEAVVRPAGIVTFAGTVATCGLSLTSVTVRPLVDGGCVSVTSIFAAGEFEAKLIAKGESARPICLTLLSVILPAFVVPPATASVGVEPPRGDTPNCRGNTASAVISPTPAVATSAMKKPPF